MSTALAVAPDPPTPVARYEEMCNAIAAAYRVDEVKDIRDKALALQVYARQAKNTEAERQACEIRLRAERRAGQILAETQKAKGAARPGGRPTPCKESSALPERTLADEGISHRQSSDWQKLASVPKETFDKAVAEPRATTSGIIAAHASPKPKDAVNAQALWLWGRLLDFKREGLLDHDPNALIAGMLEHMRVSTHELAPQVAAWLGRINA